MMMIKKEESMERNQMFMAEGESQGTRCGVKRRRRESAAPALDGEDNQSRKQQQQQQQQVDQNSATSTVKRSSRFRGVSRHRWTGRFEAHLWDKLSWNVTQKKKGKQGIYI
ncbi:hypothetical protein L6164_005945 [Bauhinia variegata]|uniref:Uncharacterized protein n=1 Tax=Bauhinia variegata TaxID=167791 RepID=A0ACB9PVI9_BAUVA|nr:hypothetical protein L6164_005945 [Bauhinia variegata]